MKPIYLAAALVVIFGAGYVLWTRSQANIPASVRSQGAAIVDVIVPQEFSANATLGKRGFEAKCAACHGLNAAGVDGAGPPLVHQIYEPNHHGDQAFYVAARSGVRQHHWPFGNMPPVAGVTKSDVKAIVAYVRELQAANGIH